MSAQIDTRSDIDTITRKEIANIICCSRSKMVNIINLKRFAFPAPVSVIKNEINYDRDEVMEWLRLNDMKTLEASGIPRADPCASTLDNKLATQFITRKTPIKSWGGGES